MQRLQQTPHRNIIRLMGHECIPGSRGVPTEYTVRVPRLWLPCTHHHDPPPCPPRARVHLYTRSPSPPHLFLITNIFCVTSNRASFFWLPYAWVSTLTSMFTPASFPPPSRHSFSWSTALGARSPR